MKEVKIWPLARSPRELGLQQGCSGFRDARSCSEAGCIWPRYDESLGEKATGDGAARSCQEKTCASSWSCAAGAKPRPGGSQIYCRERRYQGNRIPGMGPEDYRSGMETV